MGVANLLKYLGPLLRPTNIYSAAAGKRVGVDGHVWLHQLAFHWAGDIVNDDNFEPLANEFLQQAQYVLGQGVELLFVFDGAPTPAKKSTDQQRQRKRADAYARVMHGSGTELCPNSIRAAVKLGWPAVKAVISRLRQHGIPYIVAPYEADTQLSYLAASGVVWACATVDSDFIIHGIQRVFFRVTWSSGRANMWDSQVATNWVSWPDEAVWKTPFLTMLAQCGLGFLTAYSLSVGCDYDTKVSNVGPGRALTVCKNVKDSLGAGIFKPIKEETLKCLATHLCAFQPGT